MIRPTADAPNQDSNSLYHGHQNSGIEFLEQEYGGDFLLQHRAQKKLIRNLKQKIESVLLLNLPPKTDGSAAQSAVYSRAI